PVAGCLLLRPAGSVPRNDGDALVLGRASRRAKDADELLAFVDPPVQVDSRDDPGPARHLQPVYGLADFLPRHADLVHEVGGALGRSRFLVVAAAACSGWRDLSRDVLADGAAIDFGGHVQARHGQTGTTVCDAVARYRCPPAERMRMVWR